MLGTIHRGAGLPLREQDGGKRREFQPVELWGAPMVGFFPATVGGERGGAFGGSWGCWGAQGEEGGVKRERGAGLPNLEP